MMKIGRQCTNISLFVLVIAKYKTFVIPLATVTFYFFPGHITIYPAVILPVLNTFWVLMTLPLAFLLLEWSGKSSERLATWTHRSAHPVSLNVESVIGHLGPGLENVWDLTVAFIRMTSVILLTFGTFAVSPPPSFLAVFFFFFVFWGALMKMWQKLWLFIYLNKSTYTCHNTLFTLTLLWIMFLKCT